MDEFISLKRKAEDDPEDAPEPKRQRLSDEADKAILSLERDAHLLASQIASKILGRELE